MTALPALALVALAIFARKIEGSWLAPSAFFAGYWALFVAAVQLLAPELPVHSAGLWWIVASAAALSVGSWIGIRLWTVGRGEAVRPPARAPALARITLLLTALGFVAPWSLLTSRGESASVFLSFDTLAQVGRDFSVSRYLEGYVEPIPARFGLMAVYGAALMGGYLLGQRGIPVLRRLIGLLPIIPATGVTLVVTTKASLYITLILIASAFLTTRIVSSRISWKAVAVVAVALVVLIPGSILVNLNRYGYSVGNSLQVAEVTSRTHASAFGSVPAFTYWFDHMPQTSDLMLGSSSFFGPSHYLSGNARINGVYTDFVSFGDASSNVYTIYRGLIEDFGLPGSLLVMFCLGLVSRIAYVRAKAGHVPAAALLGIFYAVTAWSFVINLTGYDTVIGGLLIFLAYCSTLQRSRAPREQVAILAGQN